MSAQATRFGFGEALTLQGWHVAESVNVQPCEVVVFTSWWQTSAPLDAPYSMTLVLANNAGIGVARNDQVISSVWPYTWEAGRAYLDERSIVIPCDAAPGDYALLLDVYNPETLEFLPASLPDGITLGQQVYLTILFVH